MLACLVRMTDAFATFKSTTTTIPTMPLEVTNRVMSGHFRVPPIRRHDYNHGYSTTTTARSNTALHGLLKSTDEVQPAEQKENGYFSWDFCSAMRVVVLTVSLQNVYPMSLLPLRVNLISLLLSLFPGHYVLSCWWLKEERSAIQVQAVAFAIFATILELHNCIIQVNAVLPSQSSTTTINFLKLAFPIVAKTILFVVGHIFAWATSYQDGKLNVVNRDKKLKTRLH